jgi:hypothetical protein
VWRSLFSAVAAEQEAARLPLREAKIFVDRMAGLLGDLEADGTPRLLLPGQ